MTHNHDFTQWETAVAAWEQADRKTPPPSNPILFAGSSTMTLWLSLKRDFPGLPVVNRGFGGAEIEDATYFAPRILLPLRPRQIVFYAGENDISVGKTAQRVFADFRRFVHTIQEALPETVISFVSIKPSPGRREHFAEFREANRLIREWISGQSLLDYIDLYEPMLGPDGEPKTELWTSDGIHIGREAYKLWASVIRPYLRDV